MSIATLIIGNSGTGKTASLRNLDPKQVLMIQTIKKPLPFRAPGWDVFNNETKQGTVFASRKATHIIAGIKKVKDLGKSIVIIDDWQYQAAGHYMDKALETGYAKFTAMAKDMWDVAQAAIEADNDVRIYFLTHSQSDEYGGNTKMKTLGKMLDEKVTIEGLFSTVLRSHVSDGKYTFSTQNDGSDTVKSPMGLFSEVMIDNDLNEIDNKICEYYGINKEVVKNE